MRYGVDSRDGFASKERELAARGIVWGGPSDARDRPMRERGASGAPPPAG